VRPSPVLGFVSGEEAGMSPGPGAGVGVTGAAPSVFEEVVA